MKNYDNQLYQNLMLGEFASDGDLIQLITDEEGEGLNHADDSASEIPI